MRILANSHEENTHTIGHDKDGNLYMTIARVDRIPVDQIGNIDPNREAQWGQYEDGPIDQGQ